MCAVPAVYFDLFASRYASPPDLFYYTFTNIMSSPVELYVYDLSNGMARQLSAQLTGRQIDGIWYTLLLLSSTPIA
jgi:hypothetical protein